jgi:3'(2'), 5'-bisphosphate nucleotidase
VNKRFENNYILKTLLLAVYKAGVEILSVYKNEFKVDLKSDSSPITVADRRSHKIIIKEIELFGLPVISEEGKIPGYSIRKEWPLFWLIDPLDGTKEFVSRNGEFTVNIALIENGIPVIGVVYAPVLDICYYASERRGSFKLNEFSMYFRKKTPNKIFEESSKLPVKNKRKNYVIVASKSHMDGETEKFIAEAKNKNQDIEIISRGSSIKLCMIAEGTADVYPRFGPTMEWDIAAGHAIVKYAGGKVICANGKELTYNKRILKNPGFVASR